MIMKIINPSKEIFEIIDYYTNLIQKILPKSKITLVGSLAVPMCGQEEFDLIIEIDENKDILRTQELIAKNNERFGIGPIEKEVGYCRSKRKYGIICELHIVHSDNKKIKRCKNMVKKLQENKELRQEYEALKVSFDRKEKEDYRKAKSDFIQKKRLLEWKKNIQLSSFSRSNCWINYFS